MPGGPGLAGWMLEPHLLLEAAGPSHEPETWGPSLGRFCHLPAVEGEASYRRMAKVRILFISLFYLKPMFKRERD